MLSAPSFHSGSPRVQFCLSQSLPKYDRIRQMQDLADGSHVHGQMTSCRLYIVPARRSDSRVNQFSSYAILALSRGFRMKVLRPPVPVRTLPSCPLLALIFKLTAGTFGLNSYQHSSDNKSIHLLTNAYCESCVAICIF